MRESRKIGAWMPLPYLAAVAAPALGCLILLLVAAPIFHQRSLPTAHLNPGALHIGLLRAPDPLFPSQRTLFATRPLFHYSIIPGGVETPRELQNAIAHDPVVAAHYAGFNLSKTCLTHLDHDRSVYVSYRVGEKVFWTKKPLKLAKGETLITDGAHMARTRCGNRISESPMEPISPAEPQPEALETAQDPGLLSDPGPAFELPLDPPQGAGIQVAEHHREIFIPPFLPVYWGGPSSTPGIPVNPPPSTPLPPVTSTPEPGTLLLLSTGFSTAWLLRRSHRN
jgi:hypothetical protein